jgi:hypothetical protein
MEVVALTGKMKQSLAARFFFAWGYFSLPADQFNQVLKISWRPLKVDKIQKRKTGGNSR